ncbi:MAG TPA: hypothetical protein DE315_08825 [Candidatus Omnitrophica bacterium]|nr:MAG: hypothetical protein A2Y05_00050 [Omnitrophica WOR_2 bacterium GWA2_53_43]HBO96580.1 hypothetical protein [Candidatus Omnitrophota bacterium]HCI45612.1 hypothetical protein [Candidatus Omnitrophota bacterium]
MFSPIIPYHRIQRPVLWHEQFGRRAPLEVEIGSGLGEFLIRSALAHPRRDYVGIELNWERICKTLTGITAERRQGRLRNIRLLKIDARVAFERLFLPRSIDHVHCLFPCPWPKKGHIKHRLFSNAFLKLVNSRLKQRGRVKIVTDFLPYREWIWGEMEGSGFEVAAGTIEARYDTKFERKWQKEGQKEFYELDLTRTESIAVPVKEDAPLQAYQLKEFDPQRFCFENQAGAISVIFKEMLFDPARQKAMVHVVAAEEELTQHVWITVMKKGKIWRVCKSDGQNVLPTPAVARAIELVYEAGKKQG